MGGWGWEEGRREGAVEWEGEKPTVGGMEGEPPPEEREGEPPSEKQGGGKSWKPDRGVSRHRVRSADGWERVCCVGRV